MPRSLEELVHAHDRPRPQAARRPAAERRREIALAAVDLVATHGLAALRVEDIAARCGLAKTTVYLYYRTRDELVLETVRRIAVDHFGAILEPADADDATAALNDFLCELCRASTHPAVQAVFAGGPAAVAAESAPAADLVRDMVARLVARLQWLATEAGAERSMIALAPMLVPGLLVSSAWSMPPCSETLLDALAGGLRLEAA